MPTVPAFNQPTTSSPGPAQNVFATATGATPDAFGSGIGKETEGLGQTINKMGDMLEQRAQQFQAQENEATANEASTNYLIKQSEITENFKQLQGKDPKAAMAQYTSDLKSLKDSMRAALPNDEARRLFDSQAQRQFGYAIMNGASYSATQYRQYETGQRNAKVQAIVHATTGAEDQSVFEAGLKDIDQTIRADNKGKSEEEISGLVRDKQGQAWRKRLADVADNDPEEARKIFTRNRANIDGLVAQDVEKYINSQDVRVTSQRIANNVVLGGATDTKPQKIDYMLGSLTPKWGKYGAAAIVSQTMSESSFNTAAVNPGDGSDGSDSIGIQQWNGPRAVNLKAFAERNGLDWRDFKTQVRFIDHELQTTHRDVGEALKKATSPQEAADIATMRYEVPKGAETGDVRNVKGYDSRRSQAVELASRTVMPISTLTPGNRGALEESARKSANAYADANGLDQRTREDLVKTAVDRLDTQYSKQMASVRDATVGGKATLTQHVMSGPDGKNPITDIDQVLGPQAPAEVRRAFLELPPAEQEQVRSMVKRNATAALNPTVETPATIAEVRKYQDMKNYDPDGFLKLDVTSLALPRKDIIALSKQQASMVGKEISDDERATTRTNIDRAMTSLKRNGLLDVNGLRDADVKQDPSRMQVFRGALAQELDALNIRTKGAPPTEKDIKEIGARLLQETVVGGYNLPLVGNVGGTATRGYQSGGPKTPPPLAEIPQEFKDKMTEQAQRRGIRLTPQEFRTYYQKHLDSQKSAKAE